MATEEEKKAAAAKKKADKKAAADKKKADKKAAADKKKAAADNLTADFVGKDLKVKLSGGAEFEGLCTCVRKTNSGAQVLLRIKGEVARFFNAEDIVE